VSEKNIYSFQNEGFDSSRVIAAPVRCEMRQSNAPVGQRYEHQSCCERISGWHVAAIRMDSFD
jgi:hypothetical protein